MTNYVEKTLHHIKRKMSDKYIVRGEEPKLELIFFEEAIQVFSSWEKAYNYIKDFTKTTKRNWVEDKKDCPLVVWDTDLEPEEQDCVDYLLEWFNYEQGSFELEELREILLENKDEENLVNACDILIQALIRKGKEIIEID